MNILNKLTIKDLKLNRKRTIGTLIGIILSSLLITVVGEMFYTMQNTMIQTSIQQDGYYHIKLFNVNKEEVETIKENNNFSHSEVTYDLGQAVIKVNGESYPFFHLYSMSKETADYLKYEVTQGRFPNNSNEIVIDEQFSKDNNFKIGNKIKVQHYYILDENGNYIADNDHELKEIHTTAKIEDEFVIVGYVKEFYNVITTGEDADKIYMYLTLNNVNDYNKNIDDLLGIENFERNGKSYELNGNLLGWEVFSNMDKLPLIYELGSIIILIILITSVFAIRNSFAISTNEKVKTYGMLSSIGATKKQIKNMVLFEGMYLGIIGIPIGSILGSFSTWILVQIINNISINAGIFSNELHLHYKFSFIPILIAILIGIIMIYLSIRKSAKEASRVMPIQSIRNFDNLSSNKIKLNVPKWIKKNFKIGGVLAYKNLKRNKKKYRVTVVSLTISVFIFITVSFIINYVMNMANKNFGDKEYNVIVRDTDGIFSNSENLKILEGLEKSVTEYKLASSITEKNGHFIVLDPNHAVFKDIVNTYVINKYEDFKDGIATTLLIYDDNYFEMLAQKINKDFDNIKDKAIVVNKTRDINIKDKTIYREVVDYQEGDTIKLTDINSNSEIDYKIGAIIDEEPIGYEGKSVNTLMIIVNKNYFNVGLKPNTIYYESSNPNELIKNIEATNLNVSVNNLNEQFEITKAILTIVSICTYSFIAIITLIGITSVFNTISSNMQLRRREFANLKSIGMTKKEFNNMIYLESIFYSSKSLIIGIILGVICSYIVYKIIATQWDFGYMFPIVPICISVVFVISIVLIIMKYSISKINKQNIIETIRNENI